ncbi:hypothetical protein H9L39_15194 [Fusarium oxysporum f. sp. albedinis]|nr:hypothetical protein H9L39_15194 [Fusarium oxysporum f. sp. albedinis]
MKGTETDRMAPATVTGIVFAINASIGTGTSLFCCFLLGWSPLTGFLTHAHRVSDTARQIKTELSFTKLRGASWEIVVPKKASRCV